MALQPCTIYQVLACEKLGFNRVLLRPQDAPVVVPIVIGSNETAAIVRGLQKETPPRPMTHDLLVAAIEHSGARVEKVVVTKLDGGTFHADLFIRTREGESTTVDARPSDCMAIATLTDAPLFVDDTVIESAGVPLEETL
ncbi:MAG: bifunctional nuclease family protein [Planctomycetota bacterium]